MISHYLLFNRNCSEALDTYVKAFEAQITEMQKYGDVPNSGFPIDDKDKNLILHSSWIIWKLCVLTARNPVRLVIICIFLLLQMMQLW